MRLLLFVFVGFGGATGADHGRGRHLVVVAVVGGGVAGEGDPRRGVVAGALEAADPPVDAGVVEARGELGVDEQVVDAEAGVALPVLAEVVPEREHRAGRGGARAGRRSSPGRAGAV